MLKKILASCGVLLVTFFSGAPMYAQTVMKEYVIGSTTPDAEVDAIIDDYFGETFRNEEVRSLSATAPSDDVVSCFDHYVFNSVEADIVPQTESVSASTPMTFAVRLKNTNAYPITNGTLYVKVFKVQDNGIKNPQGPDVVDQFVAKEQITLAANETKDLAIQWNVPVWVQQGTYRIATFFISNHAYNLLGLSFTDDVIGATATFDVLSEQKTGVQFDKQSVRVNGEPYTFAAFPPRVDSKEPITITGVVQNTTSKDVRVPVFFKAYFWDVHTGKPLHSNSVWVDIPAQSTKEVSFTITDTTYPVYLAEIRVQYNDTQSILNPRIIRQGINRLRINMPAMETYPLIAGEQASMFACVHNIADMSITGRLVLSVLDEKGAVVHTHTYTGPVSGDMIGILDSFVASTTMSTFTLRAELYQDDVLIADDYVQYRCEDFNTCDITASDATKTFIDMLRDPRAYIIYALLGVVLIVGGIFIIRNRKKKTYAL